MLVYVYMTALLNIKESHYKGSPLHGFLYALNSMPNPANPHVRHF